MWACQAWTSVRFARDPGSIPGGRDHLFVFFWHLASALKTALVFSFVSFSRTTRREAFDSSICAILHQQSFKLLPPNLYVVLIFWMDRSCCFTFFDMILWPPFGMLEEVYIHISCILSYDRNSSLGAEFCLQFSGPTSWSYHPLSLYTQAGDFVPQALVPRARKTSLRTSSGLSSVALLKATPIVSKAKSSPAPASSKIFLICSSEKPWCVIVCEAAWWSCVHTD